MASVLTPRGTLGRITRFIARGRDGADDTLVGPIRGQPLGAERLAERARTIARQQRLLPPRRERGRGPLLRRLDQTRRILDEARAKLSDAADRGLEISPAGDWLLDNYYVVLDHVLEIRTGMPPGYYQELPKLETGPLAGYPRVYEIAIELIAHTEGYLDSTNIQLFLREFQTVRPLAIGELWATPTMLRLGLIENIRRMALRTLRRLADIELADQWAARFSEANKQSERELSSTLAGFVSRPPELTAAFVTRLLQRVRARGSDAAPLFTLDRWIAEEGLSAEDATLRSNQRLALTQVGIANSITSLRTIARLEWKVIVESQSAMETVLREDPAGVYEHMTFETRDSYRHVVEAIARGTGRAEEAVARAAIERALAAGSGDGADAKRTRHVGYYLVDEGRPQLDEAVGYRPRLIERSRVRVNRHADVVYFGAMTTLLVIIVAIIVSGAAPMSAAAMVALVLLALIPASEIAISCTNQLIMLGLPPRLLPRMDFSDGIPERHRTVVVVPTLITSVRGVAEALEHLEVQFLANRDPSLHFALLTDFTDAATQTRPEDEAILEAAVRGTHALNVTYAGGADEIFFLLHRQRLWNERQRAWMGWERKRGKLVQLNHLLRGRNDGAFSTIVGDVELLRRARYVLTLDSDTQLPPDAAQRLVGTLAHPLNAAEYDERAQRVVRGYGILQPRVSVSLNSATRSRFAAIHSGHPGVDPYTTAVSDVYQDFYGEGNFTGKGLYDVDLFERSTRGRFPENSLLSHDLIEGAFTRAALVTDVTVYDDYPARYLTYTRRKHRWIRGDWQLLPWLASRTPGAAGRTRNPLSLISRWKLVDNLRRSLVEPSLVALLMAGWIVLPGTPARWTGLVLFALVFPSALALAIAAARPPELGSWSPYYASLGRDAGVAAGQISLGIAFLAHQAVITIDAVLRTLGRLGFTRRNLLEWQTASQVERITGSSHAEAWKRMWPAPALAAAAAIVVAGTAPASADSLFMAVPFIALWMVSPAIAAAMSAPLERRDLRLAGDDRRCALRYGLLHWRFFEHFVSEDTRWLAPDNYQEKPAPVVASRTSPTNIGLQLLATVSAYDLGLLPLSEMVERLELAIRSLREMRRFRGHFFNWYDLADLRVLEPPYVSTVDSGNFAGHLLALESACRMLPDQPLEDARWSETLYVSLALAVEALSTSEGRVRGLVAASVGWEGDAEQGSLQANSIARPLAELRRLAVTTEAGDALPASLPMLRSAAAALRDAARSAGMAADTQSSNGGDPLHWLDWSIALVDRVLADERIIAPNGTGNKTTLRDVARESTYASELIARLELVADDARDYAMAMDFRFLLDERRMLFSIGYDERSGRLDASYYDLLASESRLASFVAIAKDDVPPEHWFRLGRALTTASGATALVSWSGSMFEYLMPILVMPTHPFTLLDQTHHAAVERQIAYGRDRGVPWGLSESAYNVRDRSGTYQYRAFGVPDLALKRGLSKDLVVAPYASMLALLVEPEEAMRNLATLEREGALGTFGFHDALDYTRPEPGERVAVVSNYMAHHIGMSLIALGNALHQAHWPDRFAASPIVRSAQLLLDERIPRRFVMRESQRVDPHETAARTGAVRPAVRELSTADTPQPVIALLGTPSYTVMISNGGAGYSRSEGRAVTRWRADGTRDDAGQWCYVKDLTTGRLWSAAHQPVGASADVYRVTLATDRAEFLRRDGTFETRMEIAPVAEDRAEVRRVTVSNHSGETREVELTSYGEIVLSPPDADRAHPAFANLFVETEWVASKRAVLASRRPRASDEPERWCVHVVALEEDPAAPVTCETDRARFVGRGRTSRDPAALDTGATLSNTVGAVLDPVFALRVRFRLEAGESARAAFTTLVADTRQKALELADRYDDPRATERALNLSWTHAQIELQELGISPEEAAYFQQLAGHLFYSNPAMRASQEEIASARASQLALWTVGISGDWPVVLARIDSEAGMVNVRQLLHAHQYWRLKGLLTDLVILNEEPPTYLQSLSEQLLSAVMASSEAAQLDKPGGVFLRRRDLLAANDLATLRATARLHLVCDGVRMTGTLETVERDLSSSFPAERVARTTRARFAHQAPLPRAVASRGTGNGFGGLTKEGAYEIRLDPGVLPPAPWSNIVSNARGGFCVTERGGGFTWVASSYFYRLTPWYNDPVSDPCTEALYLRDEESGELWCPTPGPCDSRAPYLVRHEAGATTFEHTRAGIATTLMLGMAVEEPVKIARLRVRNESARRRRLSLTSFVEWSLGAQREHTQHQIRTQLDNGTRGLLADNVFISEYASLVAFSWMSEPLASWTADRREFIGRNGDLGAPAGVSGQPLSGASGAGLDPCAALQARLDLAPGEVREIVVLLGAAEGAEAARGLIRAHGEPALAGAALGSSLARWRERLDTIQVTTPSPEFDALVNGWTLYQALSCRMWGRSALYQSSGAYGFRDQLQDVMAFLYAEPAIAREHILRCAGRQFVEGDVQHWWHPQTGRGVRTRISDDLAWLPFVAARYVEVTGDAALLDEHAPYLTMRQLAPEEHEIYDAPQSSGETGSVYDHCVRALRRACTTGPHSLPLIGGGDWNDGMNRVGIDGRGESVWLAWFLIAAIRQLLPWCDARGDADVAERLRERANAYVVAAEAHAWDGGWYRRAYFDDGSPLGSAANEECAIDSIAQSWSVISGAGEPARTARAMASLGERLVREDARLIMLLTPPFDRSARDPGYIKGYLPGVRENGAQYTHAALWAVLATAMQGDGDRAFALFQMLNPLMHSRTRDEVMTYRVEPYVIAADVYTATGHMGRGGWTWYTGSASWSYRVALEGILGVNKRGETLAMNPCIPREWRRYELAYRYGRTRYAIAVENPFGASQGVAAVTVDGAPLEGLAVPLRDDGVDHQVVVMMGPPDQRVG